MAFRVQILNDSVNEFGSRLLTWRLEFPTQILKEVNTHTILSRNASSSRAIPVATKMEYLAGNPDKGIEPGFYKPIHFGKNQGGMQAFSELEEEARKHAEQIWTDAFYHALHAAQELNKLETHKQEVNPLFEAFDWTRQVLSGTDWPNFFALRTHKDAKPAFRFLARAMYLKYRESTPKFIPRGKWHLPFVSEQELSHIHYTCNTLQEIPYGKSGTPITELIRSLYKEQPGASFAEVFPTAGDVVAAVVSTARCARVSRDSHVTKKKSTLIEDCNTFETLAYSEPRHMSPCQHANTPMHGRHGNHLHWLQLRKMIGGENIDSFNPSQEELAQWEAEIPASVFCDKEEDWKL